jgi:hypothetical protein
MEPEDYFSGSIHLYYARACARVYIIYGSKKCKKTGIKPVKMAKNKIIHFFLKNFKKVRSNA